MLSSKNNSRLDKRGPPVEFANIFFTQVLVSSCLVGIGGKWKKQLFKSWKHSLEIETSRIQALIVHLSSPLGLLKGNVTFPESEESISVHVTQVGLKTSHFPDSKNWNSHTHVTPLHNLHDHFFCGFCPQGKPILTQWLAMRPIFLWSFQVKCQGSDKINTSFMKSCKAHCERCCVPSTHWIRPVGN